MKESTLYLNRVQRHAIDSGDWVIIAKMLNDKYTKGELFIEDEE